MNYLQGITVSWRLRFRFLHGFLINSLFKQLISVSLTMLLCAENIESVLYDQACVEDVLPHLPESYNI